MSYHCKEKVWLNDISCLCNDYRLLPLDDMSNEQKFNSITRALLFIIVILYLIDYRDTNKVIMLSIFLLIVIYFIQKNNEPYNKMENINVKPNTDVIIDGLPKPCTRQPQPQSQPQSQPQRQSQPFRGNPKVLDQPRMVPGLYDDVWNDDINSRQSVINQPPVNYDGISGNIVRKDDTIEPFLYSERVLDLPTSNEPLYEVNSKGKSVKKVRFDLKDNSSKCGKSITTNIGSGLTINEEMIEPIDFNFGGSHSFDETHKTTKFDKDKQKYIVTYHKEEPEDKTDIFTKECQKQVDIDDIYDPRLSGSGSNDRYFFDKNSNTIKYYYDDVNCIRKANYLIRSHIDTVDFADSTGPYKKGVGLLNRDDSTSFRDNINKKYQDDNMDFRVDMMSNITRKLNRRKIHDDEGYKHTNNMNTYTI